MAGVPVPAVVLAAAVVVVSVTGCVAGPEPAPVPAPSATAAPPSGPVSGPGAPVLPGHDPAWTEDQAAAVGVVEEYRSLQMAMRKDPQNDAYWLSMPTIAEEPLLSEWMERQGRFQESGERYSEDAETVYVSWSVGSPRDVDGRKEVELSWCGTATPAHAIQADGRVRDLEPRQTLWRATAQLVPDVGWRLIKAAGEAEPC